MPPLPGRKLPSPLREPQTKWGAGIHAGDPLRVWPGLGLLTTWSDADRLGIKDSLIYGRLRSDLPSLPDDKLLADGAPKTELRAPVHARVHVPLPTLPVWRPALHPSPSRAQRGLLTRRAAAIPPGPGPHPAPP
jgi:hypothetical protein